MENRPIDITPPASKKPTCDELFQYTGKVPIKVKAEDYIECFGYKGRPRKSVTVCRKCRRRHKCSSFQEYLQPGLPFTFTDK